MKKKKHEQSRKSPAVKQDKARRQRGRSSTQEKQSRRRFAKMQNQSATVNNRFFAEALSLAKQVHAGKRTSVRHLCDDLQALLEQGRPLTNEDNREFN